MLNVMLRHLRVIHGEARLEQKCKEWIKQCMSAYAYYL